MTKDGVLIANHDQCLKDSTDAVLFDGLWKNRQKTTVFSNGNTCTIDYIIPEFTLAEIKQVKRKQRFEYRSTSSDGLFTIPTFEEAIQFMQMMKQNYTRKVGAKSQPGLYIEIKEPVWYRQSYGVDTTQAIFDVLAKYNLETIEKATDAGIPIIIQSFSEEALRQFATLSDLPLI